MVPAGGQNTTQDEFIGKIESVYAATGPFETTHDRMIGLQSFYPENAEDKLSIIIWANGSKNSEVRYIELCRHLASWGFAVIIPDSTLSGSGEEILETIDYLIQENSNANSLFFGKLDLEQIGVSGHALGASSAINAASDPRIACVAPIAPAPASVSNLIGPMFLVVAACQSTYSPEMVRHTIYSNSKVATIFGTIINTKDADFVPDGGKAKGYLTAWFRYLLQHDEKARKAFLEDCEICNNVNWQVERKRRTSSLTP
ncbi:MAG: hypothetical protein PVI90_05955 [Desulfobacteraceae bacterium]